MNLNSVVAPYAGAVNPRVAAQVYVSNGYSVTNDDGTQSPSYAPPVTVQAQVQALQFRDIMQLQGLNLQGTRRAIYLHGDVEGLIRTDKKGGDLIVLPDGSTWLVAVVLETWGPQGGDMWTKVACTLQVDSQIVVSAPS